MYTWIKLYFKSTLFAQDTYFFAIVGEREVIFTQRFAISAALFLSRFSVF